MNIDEFACLADFRYCWQEYRRCIIAERPRWRELIREAIADIRYCRRLTLGDSVCLTPAERG